MMKGWMSYEGLDGCMMEWMYGKEWIDGWMDGDGGMDDGPDY